MEISEWIAGLELVAVVAFLGWFAWDFKETRKLAQKEDRMYRAIVGIQIALQSINLQLRSIATGTAGARDDTGDVECIF